MLERRILMGYPIIYLLFGMNESSRVTTIPLKYVIAADIIMVSGVAIPHDFTQAKTGTRITMKHAMNLSQSKNTILSVDIILQVYGILCSTSCRWSHG